jgi:hypothetical protein
MVSQACIAKADSVGQAVYISRLRQHTLDNNKFDAVVRELRSDRTISVEGMRAIASAYLGYQISNGTGREAALGKIVDSQVMDARYSARAPHQTGGGI